jgi:hypothetical protein
MVLSDQIAGYDVSRIFMDAGSGINLIHVHILRAMNISQDNLAATDTSFHGIHRLPRHLNPSSAGTPPLAYQHWRRRRPPPPSLG